MFDLSFEQVLLPISKIRNNVIPFFSITFFGYLNYILNVDDIQSSKLILILFFFRHDLILVDKVLHRTIFSGVFRYFINYLGVNNSPRFFLLSLLILR